LGFSYFFSDEDLAFRKDAATLSGVANLTTNVKSAKLYIIFGLIPFG